MGHCILVLLLLGLYLFTGGYHGIRAEANVCVPQSASRQETSICRAELAGYLLYH